MKDDRKIVVIVLIAILLILLLRRVSGFIVTPDNNELSMMDLKEFSYLKPEQKTAYRTLLTQRADLFTSNTSNFVMYMQNVSGIMSSALSTTSPVTTTTSPVTCSTVLVMGDCLSSNMCPNTTMTKKVVNGNTYCVCPTATPYLRMSPTIMCSATQCSTNEYTLTERATGQRACAPSCPTTQRTGYTCAK